MKAVLSQSTDKMSIGSRGNACVSSDFERLSTWPKVHLDSISSFEAVLEEKSCPHLYRGQALRRNSARRRVSAFQNGRAQRREIAFCTFHSLIV
jgi:hypothetical protein